MVPLNCEKELATPNRKPANSADEKKEELNITPWSVEVVWRVRLSLREIIINVLLTG